MKIKFALKIVGCIAFGCILFSLFLPYYERYIGHESQINDHIRHFGSIKIYWDRELDGFVEVISGFGSIFGVTNGMIHVALVIGYFLFQRQLLVFAILASVFIVLTPNGRIISLSYESELYGAYFGQIFMFFNLIISWIIFYLNLELKPPISNNNNLLDDLQT